MVGGSKSGKRLVNQQLIEIISSLPQREVVLLGVRMIRKQHLKLFHFPECMDATHTSVEEGWPLFKAKLVISEYWIYARCCLGASN